MTIIYDNMCIATSKTEVVHREAMNALGRPGLYVSWDLLC